jgi:hypothetical protein
VEERGEGTVSRQAMLDRYKYVDEVKAGNGRSWYVRRPPGTFTSFSTLFAHKGHIWGPLWSAVLLCLPATARVGRKRQVGSPWVS